MTTDSIRVPLVVPGTRAELADIEANIQAARGRISVLYQVLLNSAPLAQGWEALLTVIRNHTQVPPDLRELIILRVAVLNGADYEFEAHVPHAKAGGLDDSEIAAAKLDGMAEIFDEEKRCVLSLTDCMTRDIRVAPAVFDAVLQRFGVQTAVEIAATIAAYNMVSRFLLALGIEH